MAIFPWLVLPHLWAANPPSAQVALERSESFRSPEIDYAVDFTLQVTNPDSVWKERTAAYTMIAHGKDRSLVIVREPEQLYPSTLLIDRGYYWLLLPRSDRPFQLAPRHVLNGDIANGDLARGNLLKNYSVDFGGEGSVGGRDCWILELTRTANLALYSRVRAHVSKKDFRPLMFEYFGNTGTLLKTALYEDYRRGPLGIRSMRIVVDNHARPGERTVMRFSDLRAFDSSEFEFTREALPGYRDAARAKHDADGGAIRPEELRDWMEKTRR